MELIINEIYYKMIQWKRIESRKNPRIQGD